MRKRKKFDHHAYTCAYAYVGPVFTGHRRFYASAFAYVASENQAFKVVNPYLVVLYEKIGMNFVDFQAEFMKC